ncbi:hypothetical protein JCM11491_006418 [Sporobolomyces phaffii]
MSPRPPSPPPPTALSRAHLVPRNPLTDGYDFLPYDQRSVPSYLHRQPRYLDEDALTPSCTSSIAGTEFDAQTSIYADGISLSPSTMSSNYHPPTRNSFDYSRTDFGLHSPSRARISSSNLEDVQLHSSSRRPSLPGPSSQPQAPILELETSGFAASQDTAARFALSDSGIEGGGGEPREGRGNGSGHVARDQLGQISSSSSSIHRSPDSRSPDPPSSDPPSSDSQLLTTRLPPRNADLCDEPDDPSPSQPSLIRGEATADGSRRKHVDLDCGLSREEIDREGGHARRDRIDLYS